MQQRNDQDRRYYLSTADFAAYQGGSLSSVKRKIRKQEIAVVKFSSSNARRKGRLDNFIHYSALKKAAQDKFLVDRKIRPTTPEKNERLEEAGLKVWQKEKADRRLSLVQEYRAMLASCPRKKKMGLKNTFAEAKNLSRRTLDRWLQDYNKAGYAALSPGWTGGQKEKIIDDGIAKFVEKHFLIPFGPPLLKTYEDLVKEFSPSRERLPSYRTVAAWVNTMWTKSQQMLLRDSEQWNKKYSPFVRRDWSKVPVNEVWIADAKQIDIACIHRGKAVFPWLTVVMDAGSRKFTGWILTPIHDMLAVGQSIIYGVQKHGIPGTFYADLGKPYLAKYIEGEKIKEKAVSPFDNFPKTRIPGLLGELGIEVFHSSAYNGREKPIEANFGIFTERSRPYPGYRGHNTKLRPKKLAHELKTGKLLSFEELRQEIDQLIHDRNARPHSTTKKTPNSFFENFVPQIPSKDVLAFLLMDQNFPTVKDSTVTLKGLVYRSDSLWKIAGERVECRRDPQDIRQAAIIYKDKLFGFASLETPSHYRDAVTLESVKTARRIRRRISKWRKAVLESEDIIDDPLNFAVELEAQEGIRKRDIRPAPSPKVVQLHQKQKLAGDVARGLKKARKTAAEGPPEEIEEENLFSKIVKKRLAEGDNFERKEISLIKNEDLDYFFED